ncbi:FMN-binding protein [Thiomonas sp.]|jgi:Na+-translocating ferredoxin:NAD+ oxidoreductase RnfG subunit|uniref:FMN-binding protein n=1 Tax=Thiomonas sp. TaxID=2047785 RepID=UPI002623FB70|nr:FMN-binding protein [Thiomonas sp.]
MTPSWPVYAFLPVAAFVAAPVGATQYLTVEQAQKALFPEAERFVAAPVQLTAAQKAQIEEQSGLKQRWDKQDVWRAEKAGKLLGWVVVDDVVGKHEFIHYAAGLLPEGRVRGVEVLIFRETYGDQIRQPEWRRTLAGKTLADPFKLDQDVPNISGATLSCRNVMNGVKRLLVLQRVALQSAP